MAAQPIVRLSYDEPIETYEVNVIGTAKVLEAARKCSNLKAISTFQTSISDRLLTRVLTSDE